MLQIYRPAPPIHWDWLSLKGPDAADFLHRLTTVNVHALQPGEGSPGFFLSAQGKIRAYFRLWKLSSDEFFMELDAGATAQWKRALHDVIEQFHFGEKFTMQEAHAAQSDPVPAWIFGDELDRISEPGHMRELETGIRVFNHGSADFGKPWATAWASQLPLDTWIGSLGGEPIGFEVLERMRIEMARPRIDVELSSDTIPLDAGLREAISDNKGCYPGQEVIEKIVSLGSPARRLARIDGKGPAPTAGQSIFGAAAEATAAPAPEVGRVTSVIATDDGFQALGFLRKTHAREGAEVQFAAGAATRARIALVPEYKTKNEAS